MFFRPLALVLPLLWCAPTWAQPAAELAANPGMEAGVDGLPPQGCVHNSYGEVAASLERDASCAHTGAASLRLRCRVFRGGAAQAYLPVPPPAQGRTYTLAAWMRAEGLSVPVRILIRDVGPPYHSYLQTSRLLTPDWRPVVVIGKVAEQGGQVGIFISYQGEGTVWLDDLSLATGEHPLEAGASEVPVVKGNLVQNSGFETGLQGWTMPEMVAVEDGGVDGGHCAHWLNKSPYMLEGRPVVLKPGQSYTMSAYLRAPQPGTKVTLSLHEVGGGDGPGQTFALTDSWQRHAFAFTAQPTQNLRYYISLAKSAGADFLADNVQIEEGGLTDYRPARPCEAGFDLPRAQRFPMAGDTVDVGLVMARHDEAQQAKLRLVATDYHGGELANVELQTQPASQRVSLSFDRPGFVRLAILDCAEAPPFVLDEAQLCVLPANAAPDDLFFGSHGSVGAAGEHHAPTALAKGGARFWRLHDMGSYAQWFLVEPEKGRYVWHDEEVNALLERGLEPLGVFGRTAPWAGRDPGGEKVDPTAWPPRDWNEFAEYIYRTVDHYKGKIRCWEAWNEPWGRGFWAGTPEEYGKLLQIVYTQAKRADPDCVIIGGCFWPPMPEFTDRVLATGAIHYMDAVSYHHYCEPDAVAMGQVGDWYRAIREKIDAVGGQRLPIWMTEGGTNCPSFYWWMGRDDQARGATETVAKHLIQTKSLGAETFFYYHAWQEIGSPRMFHWLLHNYWVQLEYDGSPKPIYASYAAAASQLSGATPAGSIEEGRFRVYAFQRGADAVVALWARGALENDVELRLGLPGGSRLADMMGAEVVAIEAGQGTSVRLNSEPQYVTFAGTEAAQALRLLSEAIAASAE